MRERSRIRLWQKVRDSLQKEPETWRLQTFFDNTEHHIYRRFGFRKIVLGLTVRSEYQRDIPILTFVHPNDPGVPSELLKEVCDAVQAAGKFGTVTPHPNR